MQVSSILWRLSEFYLWYTGPEMTQSHVLRDMLTFFYTEQLVEKETTDGIQ